jgi:hypothetical protein
VDGRDPGPLLRGENSLSPHEALFFFNANVIYGVRAGRLKFYRLVNEYVWPTPLDKHNTWVGRRGRVLRPLRGPARAGDAPARSDRGLGA